MAKPAFAFFQPKYVKQHDGLDVYDSVEYKVLAEGNVYTNGAMPGSFEANVRKVEGQIPVLDFGEDGKVTLLWNVPAAKGNLVTSQALGMAKIPKQQFENADGTALTIDTDYFGNKRNAKSPNAGPFESGSNFVVWPKK